MAESPLTCEACKAASAQYLVVAEFHSAWGPRKRLRCGSCLVGTRRMFKPEALHIFALTPINETIGARRD